MYFIKTGLISVGLSLIFLLLIKIFSKKENWNLNKWLVVFSRIFFIVYLLIIQLFI